MFFLFSPRLLSRSEAQRKAQLLYIGGLSSPFDVKVDNWDSCFIKGKMLFLNCCPHLFSPAVPANILTLSYLGGQRKNSGQLHILYIDPWWGSPHTCHYFTFVHFLPLPSQQRGCKSSTSCSPQGSPSSTRGGSTACNCTVGCFTKTLVLEIRDV